MNENYILFICLILSALLNLLLFVAYRIWKNRAKKSIRGNLYLLGDEMYSEFQIALDDIYKMDTITLKVVATDSRKE